jgi:hypothetical protein
MQSILPSSPCLSLYKSARGVRGSADAIILKTTLLNVPGQRPYYELGDVTVQGSLGICQDAQTAQSGTEESGYYVYSLDTARRAFLFNFPPVGADLGLMNASA